MAHIVCDLHLDVCVYVCGCKAEHLWLDIQDGISPLEADDCVFISDHKLIMGFQFFSNPRNKERYSFIPKLLWHHETLFEGNVMIAAIATYAGCSISLDVEK